MGVDQGQEAEPPSPYCSTTFRAKNHGARTFFLPEVREFIKDTRPKTNTTRGQNMLIKIQNILLLEPTDTH